MKTNRQLYNEFFQKIDTDENSLLSLIQWQYDEWERFMLNKRDELDTNLVLYKNTLEKNGDIWDETTFATVNALIARSITEEFRWEFEADDTRTKTIVENLNATLQQDYDNDDMLAVDLYWLLFKYIMGVFIKMNVGWNWKTKTPIFNYVDPRSWIPDPNGDYATGQFGYSWFMTLIGDYAINTEWLDYENLKPLTQSYISSSLQKYRDQQAEGYVNLWENVDNPYYDIYYHYFYITDKKGGKRKAKAILWNDRTLILSLELYEDINEDVEVEFPFSFEYYWLEPNNPLGDNVVNHTAEPQKVKALNRNLRTKKAKAELYPMYFYNEKYLARKDLAFWFNKFIPVKTEQDGAVDLNSIITAFRPDNRADNSYIIDNDMDKQVERATSIGSNIQWGTQDKIDATATEAWIVQTNSDINIAYREKIANIGKKQFVRVWFQAYLHNFEDGDSKIVMLDNWIWVTPIEIKKKDLLLSSYNKIRVRSKTQVEMQRRKEMQALSQLVNLVISSDQIDSYQKLLLLRDYAEALWYAKSKINSRLSWWPEEELIKLENESLESWAFIPIDSDDNHLMHIILQKPFKNSTKEAEAHWMAHIIEWTKQWKQMNLSTNWTQQAMQASMASSNIAQMGQNTPQNAPITT